MLTHGLRAGISGFAMMFAAAGALAQHDAEGEKAEKAEHAAHEQIGFDYTLNTCAVSGEELGSMGDPIVKNYHGREVKFCCKMCIGRYEADPAKYNESIDKQMVMQQLMHYPISTCIVGGGALGSMGEPINFMYNNRLVRFCCAGCKPKLEGDPAKYFEALDQKIIESQAASYPLTACPVSGEELGSIEDSNNIVYMNRLVRLCCEGCEKKFDKEPAKFMAMLDEAYAAAQRDDYPLEACPVSGEELFDEPFEVVAGNTLVKFCCEDHCVQNFKANPDETLKEVRAARD